MYVFSLKNDNFQKIVLIKFKKSLFHEAGGGAPLKILFLQPQEAGSLQGTSGFAELTFGQPRRGEDGTT